MSPRSRRKGFEQALCSSIYIQFGQKLLLKLDIEVHAESDDIRQRSERDLSGQEL